MSPFESLPMEVIEAVNGFLDLRDLCNVRLVSRSMASKATQDHFGSFLRSRRVETTRPALESLAALTAKGRIGCFVEDLTLAGVVYNTAGLEHQLLVRTKTMLGRGCEGSGVLDEPIEPGTVAELAHAAAELDTMRSKQADYDRFHESRAGLALLTDIFHNLAAGTKRHGLTSLSLDVVEYRQDARTPQFASDRLAWRSVWRMAEQTFHTSMSALGTAMLPIRKLIVFCNDFSGRCSLQCNQLGRCNWHANGLIFTLNSLESWSVSLSDRVLNETERDALSTGDPVEQALPTAKENEGRLLPNLEELRDQVTEEANFSGLASLLHSCTKLTKLDLRRCHLRRRRSELEDHSGERFIQILAESASLERVQTLSLGNFAAREDDLLCLLQRHPIRNLKLVCISLEPGTWDAIFDHCVSTTHSLYLEDLSQGFQTILLGDTRDEIENSLIKGLRKSQNVHIRRRENDSALIKPVTWALPRYRRLGPDPVVDKRISRLRNMFGPPASHFPGLNL